MFGRKKRFKAFDLVANSGKLICSQISAEVFYDLLVMLHLDLGFSTKKRTSCKIKILLCIIKKKYGPSLLVILHQASKREFKNPRGSRLNYNYRSMANNHYLMENAYLFNFKGSIWIRTGFGSNIVMIITEVEVW